MDLKRIAQALSRKMMGFKESVFQEERLVINAVMTLTGSVCRGYSATVQFSFGLCSVFVRIWAGSGENFSRPMNGV